MSHFIVDLTVVQTLEYALRKRLKPDEIMLVSYIKSFPKGYYGSKDNLAFVLGIGKTRVYEMLKYFKEKNILVKEKRRLYVDLDCSCSGNNGSYGGNNSSCGGYNNNYNINNNNLRSV